MATSGVERSATRLLGAFYDLSGHSPSRRVPIGGPGTPTQEGAATAAGMQDDPAERDVAVRYLLDQGYVKTTDEDSVYAITVQGVDEVRRTRGLDAPPSSEGGRRMSDKTQQRLLTVLAIVISLGLSRPLNRFLPDVPERRGIKDDLLEAALKGSVRIAAIFIASLVVRRLAGGR